MMIASGINGLVDGALIQQLRCDTISNNLANLSTKGFKRDVLSFDEALTMNKVSVPDFSQGPVQHTGNSFDVALEGEGFFKVQTLKGLRYTRNGAWSLDKDNTLVTSQGDPIQGENGPIQINGSEVSIGTDGEIHVDGVTVDRLSLVHFKDQGILLKEGANYYLSPSEGEEPPRPETTRVHQGYLEESNVDLTEEMVRMVEAFRAFESIEKGIQSIDEMSGKLINDSGLF